MSKLEKTFANFGCLLRCIAVPLSNGGFDAQVEIVQYKDNKLLLQKTLITTKVFNTCEEAIEYARAWSVSWVRQNR